MHYIVKLPAIVVNLTPVAAFFLFRVSCKKLLRAVICKKRWDAAGNKDDQGGVTRYHAVIPSQAIILRWRKIMEELKKRYRDYTGRLVSLRGYL